MLCAPHRHVECSGMVAPGEGPVYHQKPQPWTVLGVLPPLSPHNSGWGVARAGLYPAWFPEVVTSPNCAHPRFLGVSL